MKQCEFEFYGKPNIISHFKEFRKLGTYRAKKNKSTVTKGHIFVGASEAARHGTAAASGPNSGGRARRRGLPE